MTPRLTIHLAHVIIRPPFTSKSEWTQLIHQTSLDTASDEIVRLADELTVIDNLGLVGAVEILMRLGVLFSVLDVPSGGDNQ
jgi:signal transduction histidine kinase